MLYLDANVILRYLLQDNEKFNEEAKNYLEKEEVFIKNEVFAEVVYVLNKTYRVPKNELKIILKELLKNENINVSSKKVINLALDIFESKNIDFVDAILCAYKKIFDYKIVTFDKKLNKCLEY